MGFLSGDGDGGSTDLSDIGSTDEPTATPDAGGYVPAPEPDTVEVNDSSGGGGSGSYTPTQPTGGEHTYDNDSGGTGWDGTSGGLEIPELPTWEFTGLPDAPDLQLPELPDLTTGELTDGFGDGVTTAFETWTDSLATGAGFFTGLSGVDLGTDGFELPELDLPGDGTGGFELPELPELPELQVPDLPSFELPELPEFDLSPPEGNVLPEGFLAGWADFLAGSTDEAVGERTGQLKKMVLLGIAGIAVLVFLQGSEKSA